MWSGGPGIFQVGICWGQFGRAAGVRGVQSGGLLGVQQARATLLERTGMKGHCPEGSLDECFQGHANGATGDGKGLGGVNHGGTLLVLP